MIDGNLNKVIKHTSKIDEIRIKSEGYGIWEEVKRLIEQDYSIEKAFEVAKMNNMHILKY